MAAGSSSDYIKHHLTNLVFGQKADGTWGLAHDAAEAAQMGFWKFHVDSLGWSFGLGILFLFQSTGIRSIRFIRNTQQKMVSAGGAIRGLRPWKFSFTWLLTKSTMISTKFWKPVGTPVVARLAARLNRNRNRMPRPKDQPRESTWNFQKPIWAASAASWARPQVPSAFWPNTRLVKWCLI